MFNLNNLIRPNIKKLIPYSSARDENNDLSAILLDANENSLGSVINMPYSLELNRYPDPKSTILRKKYAEFRNVNAENIILGVGSDEIIDLLIRSFCVPGKDNILINSPTYGMYGVVANINDVEIKEVNLTDNFQIDANAVFDAIDKYTKLVFFCSPNNPTGNLMKKEDIIKICKNTSSLVVVDEAYIDFTDTASMSEYISEVPNLFILQTFSKAWGLAALRVGIGIGNTDVINVLMKTKAPYNLNAMSAYIAFKALNNFDVMTKMRKEILKERTRIMDILSKFKFVKKIYPSDANFFVFQVDNPSEIYNFLTERNIILRDRSQLPKCKGCLRVSIGTRDENDAFLDVLYQFNNIKS